LAGFVAQGVVEALDYDFNPYLDVSGTIPEPTDTQIETFLLAMKDLYVKAQKEQPDLGDLSSQADILEALDKVDPTTQIKLLGEMAAIYSKLCSGTPTTKQINALPVRVRTIFFAWLQGEVMSPEAATGAGSAQVTNLRSARAG
jgi:hypothetical protein